MRASEIRQKLNELAAVETLTDEQRTETDKLTVEYKDVETRSRAATIAESVTETVPPTETDTVTVKPEDREYRPHQRRV